MKAKFLPFYMLSILPMPVLYGLSDFSFFVWYKLIKYRRKTVFDNLKRSFANKNDEELKVIEKKFYKHLCDIMFETVKGLTISPEEVKKRIRIKNPELIQQLYQKNKNVLLYSAHQGNWEWLTFLKLFLPYKGATLYMPISNRYFDELLKIARERFGIVCIESSKGYRSILSMVKDKEPVMLAVIGDQSPGEGGAMHWSDFFNQKTAFLVGADRIAKKAGLVVLFPSFERKARGYYDLEFKIIDQEASKKENYEIIDAYSRVLEETIRQSPEMWLWSHRRWKLSAPDTLKAS